MADGARLDSVVMFVHDLKRSVSFYSDVLNLHVADRSATAVLQAPLHELPVRIYGW